MPPGSGCGWKQANRSLRTASPIVLYAVTRYGESWERICCIFLTVASRFAWSSWAFCEVWSASYRLLQYHESDQPPRWPQVMYDSIESGSGSTYQPHWTASKFPSRVLLVSF